MDTLKEILVIFKENSGPKKPIKVEYVLDYIFKIGFICTDWPEQKARFKGYCLALIM